MAEESIETCSVLESSADTVWHHATEMSGVNYELMPLVRMTTPASAPDTSIENVPLKEVAFHSWLLAFGFLPFDRHALTLVEIDREDRRFLESSSSWMQRLWKHERIVETNEAGCVVTDRVTFEPRLSFVSPLVKPIVSAIFLHRHMRLRRKFGSGTTPDAVTR